MTAEADQLRAIIYFKLFFSSVTAEDAQRCAEWE
jgi:hypothetical protein